jgi:hypothetical protein
MVEAQFKLSPDSRLPAWFSIPEGRSRDEFVVELTLYSVGANKMVVFDKDMQFVRGLIVEDRPLNDDFNGTYPYYVASAVGEISEIIEHKEMEPVFYISDDPYMRRKLEL